MNKSTATSTYSFKYNCLLFTPNCYRDLCFIIKKDYPCCTGITLYQLTPKREYKPVIEYRLVINFDSDIHDIIETDYYECPCTSDESIADIFHLVNTLTH
jgi:hypothetical protein